jgi:hypothetical protein
MALPSQCVSTHVLQTEEGQGGTHFVTTPGQRAEARMVRIQILDDEHCGSVGAGGGGEDIVR